MLSLHREWVVSVLVDVKSFAEENNLPNLAVEAGTGLVVAQLEFGSDNLQWGDDTCEDPNVGVSENWIVS